MTFNHNINGNLLVGKGGLNGQIDNGYSTFAFGISIQAFLGIRAYFSITYKLTAHGSCLKPKFSKGR